MPPPAEGFASRLLLGPALRAQPDRRLVALVQEGYEVAFEEIVRRYAKPLGGYAAAMVGVPRAEDVTQDAFCKALRALRRDTTEIDLRPWLYRIVRNTALNDLRDRPPEAAALAEQISAGRTPAEETEQRDELAELMRRLAALPDAQRAAIVMRELEGLSHEEIAQALGLSGGAVRQSIHRARQRLREGLGLLLPLPLLRFLGQHGAEAYVAGAGGTAATAAGASAGGAGLAGGALKVGIVATVLAGSVGTGVALREDRGDRGAEDPVTAPPGATRGGGEPAAATGAPVSGTHVARRKEAGAPGVRSADGRGRGGAGALGGGGPPPTGERRGGDPGPDSQVVGTGDERAAPNTERTGERRRDEREPRVGHRGGEGGQGGRGAAPDGSRRPDGANEEHGPVKGGPDLPVDPGGSDRPAADAPDREDLPDLPPAGKEASRKAPAAPPASPAPPDPPTAPTPAPPTEVPANPGGGGRGADPGRADGRGGPDVPEAAPDADVRGKGGRKKGAA